VRRWLLRLAPLLAAAGVVFAYTTWPRLNDVETGKTPEYPYLQPREYGASPEAVTRSVKRVLGQLRGWQLVGEGKGPVGVQIQAVRSTRVFRFKDDVTIRIRSEGGRTRVYVRSKSRLGNADFGQNARNIRELLAALDRAVG
jgi:uncharacterized protein (DUF1499 family)